jgi:hypothetical protein
METPFEPDTTVADLPAVPDTTEALTLLSVSASRDDIGAALSKRPRARIPSLTLLLAILLVAGLGFIGGEQVGKNDSSSGSGFNAAALRSAFAGRAGTGRTGTGTGGTGTSGTGGTGTGGAGGFAGGGFGGSGNATIGSVKLIDGSTVYVETSTGTVVQVKVSPSTKITFSSSGTIKDLQPGEEVIVAGTTGSGGSVSATSISQSSFGSTGGAG